MDSLIQIDIKWTESTTGPEGATDGGILTFCNCFIIFHVSMS